MTGEGGGGGDAPPNEGVEVPAAANDNIGPDAVEGSNEAGERGIAWLEGAHFAMEILASVAGYDMQSQVNQIRENLYEITATVSKSEPGDAETVRALSPEEEKLRGDLEKVLERAHELERSEKERELEDAAPKPSAPKAPDRPGSPGSTPPESDARPRGRSGQAANDNDEGAGGGAPNETDD